MKYHGLKMDEVNQILEELWKRTYQGTDVDTVLIRSDTESNKGNRSYNYRVCSCFLSLPPSAYSLVHLLDAYWGDGVL